MRAFSTTRSYMRSTCGGQACERELGRNRLAPEDAGRDARADRGAELESVSRAAARDPDVPGLRVTVEDVLPVRTQLVLTYARLDERRARERGKAARDVATRRFDSGGARDAFAV